jgi:hypothetical protein
VWPIAGLKEKLLAALRGGIKTVLIPEENAKDLDEIADSIKSGLEIVPVSRTDEVLVRAMTCNLEPIEWDETTITTAGALDETLLEEESSTLTARSTIATNLARKASRGDFRDSEGAESWQQYVSIILQEKIAVFLMKNRGRPFCDDCISRGYRRQ